MKAFRHDESPLESPFFQKSTPAIPKKTPSFLSNTVINDKTQASNYLKKNYYSFDLNFNNKKIPRLSSKDHQTKLQILSMSQ